ncbi:MULTISPECIES: glycerate kinase [Arthrobacter]|uniref:Glycerate kinase n=1 Tax=Arthrobacter caoxuetaonis TaxID=2886935 RepID=A0A9X1SCX8_9MICC|nr:MULTISPECIES: glycerate kinase [Arthrobacter]MCC3281712.1 glycerate kinase [Arthrobacter caoxuetaonis]MCC3298618.1 glycerate kinase [Arthrobacter caoxuetaonis]MCC9194845.1 glycerate kinase [Arthrobacter sp. zg-Y916]USQ57359.1 glycerate kinase [Arthrobacter caoxuetaonis]
MRVLIAPDKFKGSLTAEEAAAAMAQGVLSVYPDADVTRIPVADGGEGTLEAALAAGAEERTARVRGPLGREVTAVWAMDGTTAVLETARSSGLMLVEPSVQTSLAASSFGSGELITAALDAGAREIILGIGGSAMTDGGSGALTALGLRILDAAGDPVPPGGAGLALAAAVDASGLDPRVKDTRIRIAADVTNPLTGHNGAAHVFGAQKGADSSARLLLDEALGNWAGVLKEATGVDVDVPGAGAAGGFPSGFLAFTKAQIEPGFELIAGLVGLVQALDQADLVLSGEGSIDEQSRYGKAPLEVARLAAARGIPVVLVAGAITLSPKVLAEYGVEAAVSVLDLAQGPEDAMARAEFYVARATQAALEGA